MALSCPLASLVPVAGHQNGASYGGCLLFRAPALVCWLLGLRLLTNALWPSGEQMQGRPSRRDLPLDDLHQACRVALRHRTAAAGGSRPPVHVGATGQITPVLLG